MSLIPFFWKMKKELEGVSKGLIDEQWYDHLLLGIQKAQVYV